MSYWRGRSPFRGRASSGRGITKAGEPVVIPTFTNTVPFTATGAIAEGSSPTITPGTWAESPTLTYTLIRNGSTVPGATNLTSVQAEAYTYTAADVAPTNSQPFQVDITLESGSNPTITPGTWTTPSLVWAEIPDGYFGARVSAPAMSASAPSLTYSLTRDGSPIQTGVAEATAEGRNLAAADVAPSNESVPSIAGTIVEGGSISITPGVWSTPELVWSEIPDVTGSAVSLAAVSATVSLTYDLLRDATVLVDEGSVDAAESYSFVAADTYTNDAAASVSATVAKDSFPIITPGTWSVPDITIVEIPNGLDASSESSNALTAATPTLTYTLTRDGSPIQTGVTKTNAEGRAFVDADTYNNTVAFSVSATVALAGTPTITPGTWSTPDLVWAEIPNGNVGDAVDSNTLKASAPTLTYTLTRDGSPVQTGVDLATAAGRAFVAADTYTNDSAFSVSATVALNNSPTITPGTWSAPDLVWTEIPNGNTDDAVDSSTFNASDPTLTYTLTRDGSPVQTGVNLGTATGRTFVADDLYSNTVAFSVSATVAKDNFPTITPGTWSNPDLVWTEIPNGNTGDGVDSSTFNASAPSLAYNLTRDGSPIQTGVNLGAAAGRAFVDADTYTNDAAPSVSATVAVSSTPIITPGTWSTPDLVWTEIPSGVTAAGVDSNTFNASAPTLTYTLTRDGSPIQTAVNKTTAEGRAFVADDVHQNTAPFGITANVGLGNSPVIIPGTWVQPDLIWTEIPNSNTADGVDSNTLNASATALTYTLQRDGSPVAGATGIDKIDAEAYEYVSADVAPSNDVAPSISATVAVNSSLLITPGAWSTPDLVWQEIPNADTLSAVDSSTFSQSVTFTYDVLRDATVLVDGQPKTTAESYLFVFDDVTQNDVAFSVGGGVSLSGSPTITAGTWSNPDITVEEIPNGLDANSQVSNTLNASAPDLTYTLYRDGVAVGSAQNLTEIQAEAYDYVQADIDPTNTVAPSIAGTVVEDASLSITPGTWTTPDIVWREIPNGVTAEEVSSATQNASVDLTYNVRRDGSNIQTGVSITTAENYDFVPADTYTNDSPFSVSATVALAGTPVITSGTWSVPEIDILEIPNGNVGDAVGSNVLSAAAPALTYTLTRNGSPIQTGVNKTTAEGRTFVAADTYVNDSVFSVSATVAFGNNPSITSGSWSTPDLVWTEIPNGNVGDGVDSNTFNASAPTLTYTLTRDGSPIQTGVNKGTAEGRTFVDADLYSNDVPLSVSATFVLGSSPSITSGSWSTPDLIWTEIPNSNTGDGVDSNTFNASAPTLTYTFTRDGSPIQTGVNKTTAEGRTFVAADLYSNDVPLSVSADVSIGNSPTITPGSWSSPDLVWTEIPNSNTGDGVDSNTLTASPTFTYTLEADAAEVAGQVEVLKSTAEAFTFTAAEVGPELYWYEIPLGDNASRVQSNLLEGTPAPAVTQLWSYDDKGQVTVDRTGEASVVDPRNGWEWDTTTPWVGSDTIRTLSGGVALIEGARTNETTRTLDLAASLTSLGSGTSLTASFVTDPIGTLSGAIINFGGVTNGQNEAVNTVPNVTGDAAAVLSVWAKNSNDFRFYWRNSTNAVLRSADIGVGAAWERVSASITTYDNRFGFNADAGQSSGERHVFMPQVEEGTFASSPIPTNGTAATRPVERVQIPIRAFLNKSLKDPEGFYIDFWPLFGSDQARDKADARPFDIGTNYFSPYSPGTTAQGYSINTAMSGVILTAFPGGSSWSAGDQLRFRFWVPDSDVPVSASIDNLTTGVSGAVVVSSVAGDTFDFFGKTLTIGNYPIGDNAFFGVFSPIYGKDYSNWEPDHLSGSGVTPLFWFREEATTASGEITSWTNKFSGTPLGDAETAAAAGDNPSWNSSDLAYNHSASVDFDPASTEYFTISSSLEEAGQISAPGAVIGINFRAELATGIRTLIATNRGLGAESGIFLRANSSQQFILSIGNDTDGRIVNDSGTSVLMDNEVHSVVVCLSPDGTSYESWVDGDAHTPMSGTTIGAGFETAASTDIIHIGRRGSSAGDYMSGTIGEIVAFKVDSSRWDERLNLVDYLIRRLNKHA